MGGAHVRQDVVAGLRGGALQLDVEAAVARAQVGQRLGEVQPHRVRAVRHRQAVGQRAAGAAGVGVALVDRRRRRVADARRVHRPAEGAAVAAGGEQVRPPIIDGAAAGVDQGHGPARRQAGGAPADRYLLADLQLLQAVGREHLDELRRADGGLGGVAVGADVDAAAVGGRLLEVVGGRVAVRHRRRARQQVEVVVAAAVARHLLEPHRPGGHRGIGLGLVGEADRQGGAADLVVAEDGVGGAVVGEVTRRAALVDAQQRDLAAAVEHQVGGGAAVGVALRPGDGHLVGGPGRQAGEGPGRGVAAVAVGGGVVAARRRPGARQAEAGVAVADRLRRPHRRLAEAQDAVRPRRVGEPRVGT